MVLGQVSKEGRKSSVKSSVKLDKELAAKLKKIQGTSRKSRKETINDVVERLIIEEQILKELMKQDGKIKQYVEGRLKEYDIL